jgi:tripartite-type tricarboxylate transporter receptor subunit TctC
VNQQKEREGEMKTKWFCGGLVFLIMFSFSSVPKVAALDYPTKPITLMGAFAAGGSTDVALRSIAPFLQKYLGQPCVVIAVPGAGGQVGWTKLSQAKPDGYYIGMINIPHIQLGYILKKGVPFHPLTSFAMIGCNLADPGTILVRNNSTFKTLKEVVEYGQKNPGKLTVIADGPQTDDHLAILKFQKQFNLKVTYVPYTGGSAALTAFLGEMGDLLFANVSEYVWTPDRLRPLAQMWPERYHLIPQVPTVKEATGVELINSSTRGLATPAGVPPEVLGKLRDAFKKAAHDPEYLEKAKKIPLTLTWMDADKFREFVKTVLDELPDIIKDIQ